MVSVKIILSFFGNLTQNLSCQPLELFLKRQQLLPISEILRPQAGSFLLMLFVGLNLVLYFPRVFLIGLVVSAVDGLLFFDLLHQPL